MKYTSRQRRLLEMAGILRPNTPDWMLLTEGDDEEDPFADDGDDGGDDEGDDSDPFADDEDEDDAADGEDSEPEEPAEELAPQDVKKYGTPIFQELESMLTDAFEEAKIAGPVRAQKIPQYPGEIEDEVEEDLAEDLPEDEEAEGSDEGGDDEEEVKQEFRNYRLTNRELYVLVESKRLLREASEEEAASAENFDMQRFCQTISDLIQHRETKIDLPGAIYNGARQMILNDMGKEGELKFIDTFEAISDASVKEVLGLTEEIEQETSDANIPVAVGGTGGGGAA